MWRLFPHNIHIMVCFNVLMSSDYAVRYHAPLLSACAVNKLAAAHNMFTHFIFTNLCFIHGKVIYSLCIHIFKSHIPQTLSSKNKIKVKQPTLSLCVNMMVAKKLETHYNRIQLPTKLQLVYRLFCFSFFAIFLFVLLLFSFQRYALCCRCYF